MRHPFFPRFFRSFFSLFSRTKCQLRLNGSRSGDPLWLGVADETMATLVAATVTMIMMVAAKRTMLRQTPGTRCASRAKRRSLCARFDLCRWALVSTPSKRERK